VVTLEGASFTATGSPIAPAVAGVTVGGMEVPLADVDVAYSDNVAPGTATVTVTAQPGGNFTGSANATFTIEAAPAPLVYAVVVHYDVWTGEGAATAVVDADHAKFVRLTLDGVEVDPDGYAVEPGSTIITLTEAYLSTLPDGSYEFVAHFTDGSSEGIGLTIARAGRSEPDTGLPLTGLVVSAWAALAAAALVATGVGLIRRSRRLPG
ncbi:MAG: hypothetical protein LBJ44_08485, partial [Propionibacteriaceae bacterium]|jgi:hypothetical protein|nr:hypothetical protein [Propionibacteriaceae bacterium]